jgi:competence ComEA-like helix-hairpin-helix protein
LWVFPPKDPDWDALVKQVQLLQDSSFKTSGNKPVPLPDRQALRPFNPNTISRDTLVLWGLAGDVIHHWTRYRAHGGRFYYKQDVLKIYGIDSSWYAAVQPYILLPDGNDTFVNKHRYKPLPAKVIEFAAVELNGADTTLLMRLPGIGIKRANAIVKYRNRLGGFWNKYQLREIRLLPDSVLEVNWNNITIDKRSAT